jgi:hypothetical protein
MQFAAACNNKTDNKQSQMQFVEHMRPLLPLHQLA